MYSHNGLKKKEYSDVIFKYIYDYTKLIDLRAKNDHDKGVLAALQKGGALQCAFYVSLCQVLLLYAHLLFIHTHM